MKIAWASAHQMEEFWTFLEISQKHESYSKSYAGGWLLHALECLLFATCSIISDIIGRSKLVAGRIFTV